MAAKDLTGAALASLLEAVAVEARPLLVEGRTGRIVINFSGGEKVRIETARFRDVSMSAAVKDERGPGTR